RLRMAGSRLCLCQRLDAARLQPYVLADHVVAAHAAWQPASALALKMEDFASLLDGIVQHPLLTIPCQPRSAAYGCLCTCHGCAPPLISAVARTMPHAQTKTFSAPVWRGHCGTQYLVRRCGAQPEPLQPRQDGFGEIRQFCKIVNKVE